MGHDGARDAKNELLEVQRQRLTDPTRHFYVEASGAVARILAAAGVPPVPFEDAARCLPGKQLEQTGPYSYRRRIGSESHEKTMYGYPIVSAESATLSTTASSTVIPVNDRWELRFMRHDGAAPNDYDPGNADVWAIIDLKYGHELPHGPEVGQVSVDSTTHEIVDRPRMLGFEPIAEALQRYYASGAVPTTARCITRSELKAIQALPGRSGRHGGRHLPLRRAAGEVGGGRESPATASHRSTTPVPR